MVDWHPSDGQKSPSRIARQLPNAITALALCSGLISVRFSIEKEFNYALAAIVASAVLDGLDGRLARRLHVSSRFGAEFDSLADFLSFGVAPIVLLFFWADDAITAPISLYLVAFALGSAIRLARFNAQSDPVEAAWRKAYFTGMPTPSAALAVLLPVSITVPTPSAMQWIGLYTLMIALLMVSRIPTFSGKKWAIGSSGLAVTGLFGIVAALSVVVVLYPRELLVTLTLLYLCSIPVSWFNFRHDQRVNDSVPVDTWRRWI
ncbi:CDP-diacylglycerol--serine O-phosphatidyltransferase [Sinorhizobium sp. BJ1]|uniref:CDP-diacylglycerol--serine O-phosphatidyltransferase n=1 Tax=Sinorhizobium sp. BJ1 TaxID=2035455 RepID=UPI0015CF5D0E|nr:CDP-diacylglycerol--serine O-phosphatidyltransferase [Sinorhizobium sp. BJ1]